jgi:hypothetical protein
VKFSGNTIKAKEESKMEKKKKDRNTMKAHHFNFLVATF